MCSEEGLLTLCHHTSTCSVAGLGTGRWTGTASAGRAGSRRACARHRGAIFWPFDSCLSCFEGYLLSRAGCPLAYSDLPPGSKTVAFG